MNQNLINLSPDSQVIGQGVFCTCYLHLGDPDLCIKLPTSHRKASKRQSTDRAYYLKLHKQKANFTHIADYLGECETSLGPGHLYQHVRDHDGETSKTVNSYFETQPETAEELIEHLVRLGRYLLKNLILISDLHGNNVLFQQLGGTDRRLMIVDGIGDRVAFTATNVFSSVKQGKIIRRWNRFIRRLHLDHPSITFSKEKLNLGEGHSCATHG